MAFFCLVFLSAQTIPNNVKTGEPAIRVQNTVDKVITMLKDQTLAGEQQTAVRRAAIREVVAEIFDFEEMAQRTLVQHWKIRTTAQQQEFVNLFADFLERNYIKTIEMYEDEEILIVGEKVDNGRAQVKTIIVTANKTEIPLDYKLYTKEGNWRVYDVSVEGVSMISNYRSQFASIINNKSYKEKR